MDRPREPLSAVETHSVFRVPRGGTRNAGLANRLARRFGIEDTITDAMLRVDVTIVGGAASDRGGQTPGFLYTG